MHNEDDVRPAYLNTKQAARYLGCSTQWLEILRHSLSSGPPYFQPIPHGKVFYRAESLDEWLTSNTRKHTAEVANG